MAAYQVVTAADKRQLSDFLIREGQFLIPIVKLIEQSELAIEQVIDVTGRACIEALLEMSAMEVAGGKSPGKASGDPDESGAVPARRDCGTKPTARFPFPPTRP
jgi:hypothetical protein